MSRDYVLITAARNEESYIERTIESVLAETIRPKRWIIVNDGSTDRTQAIVTEVARRHTYIKLINKELNPAQGGFSSKVYATRMGYEALKSMQFDYIGHLDADIAFAPDYYERMLDRCEADKMLGIGGGFIHELVGKTFKSRPSNSARSVAGAIQLFRRQCYDDIGGLAPLPMGGEDWHAEIQARMKGWQVKAFADLKVLHLKTSGRARGVLRENFRQGLVDYSLGTHPLFELAKSFRRIKERPYLLGSFIRACGFLWPYCRQAPRPVSAELVTYLRKEQVNRLTSSLRFRTIP